MKSRNSPFSFNKRKIEFAEQIQRENRVDKGRNRRCLPLLKNVGKVAVLGPEGTFTEIAARKFFKEAKFEYCDTVSEVFDSIDKGTEFGVVAIENSLEMSINKR